MTVLDPSDVGTFDLVAALRDSRSWVAALGDRRPRDPADPERRTRISALAVSALLHVGLAIAVVSAGHGALDAAGPIADVVDVQLVDLAPEAPAVAEVAAVAPEAAAPTALASVAEPETVTAPPPELPTPEPVPLEPAVADLSVPAEPVASPPDPVAEAATVDPIPEIRDGAAEGPPPPPVVRPAPLHRATPAPSRPSPSRKPAAVRPAAPPAKVSAPTAPSAVPASAGAAGSAGRPAGGRDALAAYLASVRATIVGQRRPHLGTDRGRVEVRFTIAADGRLGGIRPAGVADPALEDQALRLVRRASPVAPIPAALGRSELAMAVTVEFE